MHPTYLTGLWLILLAFPGAPLPAEGNRLAYLDEYCNPYYPGLGTARLVTPQWIGEEGVEAVIVLSIDDLVDTVKYEEFLRPILDRLKKIDGRAPLSLMTMHVDMADPLVKRWLDEGLSLEAHTYDHAAPLLQNGDLSKAKERYDRCLDLLRLIPRNKPVAFRMPYCDSANTLSPRFFTEIFNRTTPAGGFLAMDSSVLQLLTADDPALAPLAVGPDGQPRFRRYVLTEHKYINLIENYPYPYVIGGLCWEMPAMIPDDNLGRRRNGPNSPATVADMKAAIDAVVTKQGQFTLCFHPYGWISSSQIVELIDYTVGKYGKRIKFLNFREVYERLTTNLLAGHSLRASNGQDNGVRLLDVNHDGLMDVVIANDEVRMTLVWSKKERRWHTTGFPAAIVSADAHGNQREMGVRFGLLGGGTASMLVRNERVQGLWHFDGGQWKEEPAGWTGLDVEGPLATSLQGRDRGVRLRDIDGDGRCELIVGNEKQQAVFAWSPERRRWSRLPFALPKGTAIVDSRGGDAGLRFADVNGDGRDDVIFSNAQQCGVWLFGSMSEGWSRPISAGMRGRDMRLPMIVRADGTNNGVWVNDRHLYVQNEDTSKAIPANPRPEDFILVEGCSFHSLLGRDEH